MALKPCVECGHNVSEHAISCPHCGYPINLASVQQSVPKAVSKRATSMSKKYKKLPNGFGSIKKLGGKRRKPFAAYPPTTEYELNGSPKTPKAIGYYETWHEAYQELITYKKNPFDTNAKVLTFSEVYDLWYEATFVNGKKKYNGDSTRYSTQAAYKKCTPLHNMAFKDITADMMQNVIDNCQLGYSGSNNIKILFRKLFKYAEKNAIVEKDYSAFLDINMENDAEHGEPFTQRELDLLWAHSNDETVRIALIMIYSGFRIKAFETIKIDLSERIFQGGVKTQSAKNRIVPIHDLIYDFVKEVDFTSFSASQYRQEYFYPKMEELGIAITESGKKRTPHDCRHTFSWLCDTYGVEDFSKHLLMGHSLGRDVEKNVYGHRTLEQLRIEMKKILQ